jgi:hypothetical protein
MILAIVAAASLAHDRELAFRAFGEKLLYFPLETEKIPG